MALELGEPDAVGGVRHVEIEHRPDERQAACLAALAWVGYAKPPTARNLCTAIADTLEI
jgi:hypothetical protein